MYVHYNPNPKNKLTGDCVVRAICKVTGAEWLDVYLALCVEGAHEADWGNVNSVWDSYLKNKGFKRAGIPDTCPDCYTVAAFAVDHPQGAYILATGTHAVAVVDGDIYDAWNSSNEVPMYYYWRD